MLRHYLQLGLFFYLVFFFLSYFTYRQTWNGRKKGSTPPVSPLARPPAAQAVVVLPWRAYCMTFKPFFSFFYQPGLLLRVLQFADCPFATEHMGQNMPFVFCAHLFIGRAPLLNPVLHVFPAQSRKYHKLEVTSRTCLHPYQGIYEPSFLCFCWSQSCL